MRAKLMFYLTSKAPKDLQSLSLTEFCCGGVLTLHILYGVYHLVGSLNDNWMCMFLRGSLCQIPHMQTISNGRTAAAF